MTGLFGTDGIRGLANRHPITCEMGLQLGRAVVRFCRSHGNTASVVIGRDTRASGEMLEYALMSGVLAGGGSVLRALEFPTPGVAFLTRELRAGAGIVVSASHNPYQYNGFKLFTDAGFKLSEAEEAEIERLIRSTATDPPSGHPTEPGPVEVIEDAVDRYIRFLLKSMPEKADLADLKIVIDCSNGAVSRIAPPLFYRLGADVEALFHEPSGKNINQDCGSQHPATLSRRVVESDAQAGLAFDGDGDRLIAVDEQGEILTGDQILVICAKMLKEQGKLGNRQVVSTVMSNIGFKLALAEFGLEQVTTDVGDRNVLEEMRETGTELGGEDSGHIIFLEHHTTGDGLLSALQLLAALKALGQPLSSLAKLMTVLPQTLINVPVKRKPEITSLTPVMKAIENVERALAEKGRVLVRYSGTEPLCRVMVEGPDKRDVDRYAKEIGKEIDRALGPGTKG